MFNNLKDQYYFTGTLLQCHSDQDEPEQYIISPDYFYRTQFNRTCAPLTKEHESYCHRSLREDGIRIAMARLETPNVWGELEWGGTIYLPDTWSRHSRKKANLYLQSKGFTYNVAFRALCFVARTIIRSRASPTYQIEPVP